tara:strand:- start:164 stop:400 length:237 start_codon:yes stop_codon:yes gene_type:complete
MLSLSGGPYLADEFCALNGYFSPSVMRLKYYGLPVAEGNLTYTEQICAHPTMDQWVRGPVTAANFLDFEEPYRLTTDA